jgi:hypothetical protein
MKLLQEYGLMKRYELLVEFYETNHQVDELNRLIEQVVLTPFQDLAEIIRNHEINQITSLRLKGRNE